MNLGTLDKLVQDAVNFFNENNYEKAITTAIESQKVKFNPLAIHIISLSYFKLMDYDKSIESSNKGLELLETIEENKLKQSCKFKLMLNISKCYKYKKNLIQSRKVLEELFETLTDKQQIDTIQNYIKQLEEMSNWNDEYFNFKNYNDSYKLKDGDIVYILNASWFAAWESYETGKSIVSPGPISNFNIIDNTYAPYIDLDHPYTHATLKPNLQENIDYMIIPELIYNKFKQKYQIDHEIQRRCIKAGENSIQAEIYLKKLYIHLLPSCKGIPSRYINISRKRLVFDLKQTMIKILTPLIKDNDLDSRELKIWKVPSSVDLKQVDERQAKISITQAKLLLEPDLIEDSQIADDDNIVIEFRKKNGNWTISNKPVDLCANCKSTGNLTCSQCKNIKYCSVKCQSDHYKIHKLSCKNPETVQTKPKGRCGIIGLQNLGNTCFMNSALQCLSNTIPLTQYFLDGKHLKDLNVNNPLGTKGAALALAYFDLLNEMWNGSSALASPWDFKKVLQKFAPQFSGYQQHDSHELLSYLLTGLHEDLNKVKTKKYIEMPDVTDKPESEAADLCWKLFLERNQSVIVDMMYGQNKSTLVCPACQKISITFDPFLSLSLVVPILTATPLCAFLIFQDPQKPVLKVKVAIESKGFIRRIKEYFEKLYSTSFVLYLTERFLFKKFCPDDLIVENLKENVIYMYEVLEDSKKYDVVPINISKAGEKGYIYSSSKTPVSFARLLLVPAQSSTLDIANKVAEYFYKIFSLNSKPVPSTLEDHKANTIYQLNIVKKQPGLCNFCSSKCSGCLLPLSESVTLSNLLETWKNPTEPFGIELELLQKVKGTEYLNKYNEESLVSLVQKHKLDINYCLEISSLPEKLDENNKWYCIGCKDHVCATKQLKIYKLPDILIIHLLRFKKKGYYTEKITSLIDFPLEDLSMSSISEDNALYDLYAVSNHFGGTGGGHYTAYIKNPGSSSWLEMDDSHVSKVSNDSIVSSSAYILFYKRKSS